MPRPTLQYLHRHNTRHGKIMWCVRKDRSKPRIWLKATYGTPEFLVEYHAALAGTPVQHKTPEATKFTVKWAIEKLMNSAEWATVAPETRKQFSYQFERMKQNVGHIVLAQITKADVIDGRARRAGTPSDANKFVAATRKLYAFAISQAWVDLNPAQGIPKLPTSKSGEGFYTWKADDFAAFTARWPIGTMERLCFEIIACTGLRRADVHKFGKAHVKNGVYDFRPSKTKKYGVTVSGDITPSLQAAINATAHDQLVFLLTTRGTPFKSIQSLGNWFADACKAAGVKGSAHGIRKGLAALAAENGATNAELNSFFGWSHRSNESAVYIDKADRSKMSRAVGKLIVHRNK